MQRISARDIKITDIPKFTAAPTPKGYRKKQIYNSQICAFDIETTTFRDINQSIMYIWQFAIEDIVIYGRTWEEFKRFVKLLKVVTGERRTLVFVHNLSYEIQFLSGQFSMNNEDVFATEPRHVLRASIDNLEFRCSYRLTNLDLTSLTRRYNVAHQKLSGEEFDYTVLRYPWTELTEHELEYCFNDVLGLVECIHAIMELNNDTVYTLPLTSTGFVRRECKKAMQSEHNKIMECFPSYDVFKLLRAEFRGGNTHANRYYVDSVIDEAVTSYDISSSYPTQQCCRLFPCSPFKEVPSPSCRLIDRLIDLGYAVLFEITMYNVKLRNKYTAIPYIPIAKCSQISGYRNDNGRVLEADYLRIVVNEIDWHIIISQYTFTAEVTVAFKARKGKLPEGLRQCNIEFFKKKTELKGIEGQELYYMKSKELLNGIYGMSVQNPAKGSILFENCEYIPDTSLSEEQLLYKAQKRAFTLYQYGCWTTAHARKELQDGIDLVGDDKILYCDTDSVKYIGEVDFSNYNAEQQRIAIAAGLYATDKHGITHYGGVYEPDGVYTSFITQGAKKYAYCTDKGISVTVSGVGKRKGAALLTAAGGLEAFREGLIFKHCGKTRSIYNDLDYGWYNTEDGSIYISRNVVIEDQDYTLSRTIEYTQLLEESKTFLRRIIENYKIVQNSQNL